MKALLLSLVLIGLPALAACTHEVAHTESTKKDIFGNTTHEQTSVQKNDVTGDVNTEHTKVRY